ncbi:MAG: LruC domain-containing protein [Gammaproteobacteria bacterium]
MSFNISRQYLLFKIALIINGIFILLFSSTVNALESTRLTDVIKANGRGDIDLFNPSSPSRILNADVLEQFRVDNNGELVFVVDVNEASDGSESASSQGISIQSAELIFIIGGSEYRYSQFSTRTNSMLAMKGSTQRSLYSTLLGDSGSNRITPNTDSDIYSSSFDSTLSFEISQNLNQVSSARLVIQLLDTNVSLGDPEAFYDFTNGFEDIAVVTSSDAAFLDELSPGMEGAPLVLPEETVATPDGGTVYYPSQSSYYIASYEDYFPYRGDYDFNDLVVGYRVATGLDSNANIKTISGEGYLIARGAGYSHDWHLRIALPATTSGSGEIKVFLPGEITTTADYPVQVNFSGDIDLNIFTHTRQLWIDSSYESVNTLDEQALKHGHRFSFTIVLDAPIVLSDFDATPFDPYLYVRDTQFEIHLEGENAVLPYSRNIQTGETDFLDNNNYPYAQVFPEDWKVPVERVDLGEAYPDFLNFISSNRTQNIQWYNTPNEGKVKPLTPSFWRW